MTCVEGWTYSVTTLPSRLRVITLLKQFGGVVCICYVPQGAGTITGEWISWSPSQSPRLHTVYTYNNENLVHVPLFLSLPVHTRSREKGKSTILPSSLGLHSHIASYTAALTMKETCYFSSKNGCYDLVRCSSEQQTRSVQGTCMLQPRTYPTLSWFRNVHGYARKMVYYIQPDQGPNSLMWSEECITLSLD